MRVEPSEFLSAHHVYVFVQYDEVVEATPSALLVLDSSSVAAIATFISTRLDLHLHRANGINLMLDA